MPELGPGMGAQSGLNEKSTRSSVSQARLQRAPWNQKLALVLSMCVRWPNIIWFLLM
jgi:hypothetical protein